MFGERVERKRIALFNKCSAWDVRQGLCMMPNECGCMTEARATIEANTVLPAPPSSDNGSNENG